LEFTLDFDAWFLMLYVSILSFSNYQSSPPSDNPAPELICRGLHTKKPPLGFSKWITDFPKSALRSRKEKIIIKSYANPDNTFIANPRPFVNPFYFGGLDFAPGQLCSMA